MCGRYFIDMTPDDDALEEILRDLNRRGLLKKSADRPAPKLSGEIFPTDVVPVIACGRDRGSGRPGRPRPFAMRWGYTLASGRRVINARGETAAQKPLFSDGLRARRLLIPASGYYEWARHETGKRKYAIRASQGGALFMAGVYRFEAEGPVFTILTRQSEANIAFIHDRMPVLLTREAAGEWLAPGCDAAALLRGAALSVTAKAV